MNEYTKRKLNLLIHLAKIDGKFHKAERALLEEFVIEEGFNVKDFRILVAAGEQTHDVHLIDDKKEMLFLAIKLMKADHIIDKRELEFCKEIATKLGYDSGAVEAYADQELDRESFDNTIDRWLLEAS
ncbi:hypothetical protein QQ020_11675 [Fulvivirgaceae bacterium BMA12]|uniref:TerB family tellurite resistance protein n=1 Tax=Agaribacillus aureus TaxID=3051825 RepID=A0ABT8L4Q5_9BACT|nr:hypothetical protein [Fulvivirgaceae bacterium BMA12]